MSGLFVSKMHTIPGFVFCASSFNKFNFFFKPFMLKWTISKRSALGSLLKSVWFSSTIYRTCGGRCLRGSSLPQELLWNYGFKKLSGFRSNVLHTFKIFQLSQRVFKSVLINILFANTAEATIFWDLLPFFLHIFLIFVISWNVAVLIGSRFDVATLKRLASSLSFDWHCSKRFEFDSGCPALEDAAEPPATELIDSR